MIIVIVRKCSSVDGTERNCEYNRSHRYCFHGVSWLSRRRIWQYSVAIQIGPDDARALMVSVDADNGFFKCLAKFRVRDVRMIE
jgi:hypothetical protein